MPKKGEIVREYKVIEKIVVGKSVFVVSKISNEKMKFVMKVLEGGVMNDEVKIGMTLWKQCPHLVRIFEVFAGDVDDDELYLIMEYCEEGDLWKRIQKKQPPTDMEIYQFVYEGALAIQTLHKNNVIHRDIKPGNFYLVKNGGFKLGDYGVALIVSSIRSNITMTRTGTEGYVSPEILTGEKAYTNKTDIFSFGVTLLEFIIGQHPFSNSNGTINTQSILSGSPIKTALTHPHPCAQLALQMIRVDPANRPSAEDILAAGLPLLAPLHGLSGACQTLRESQATAEERAAAAEKKAETLEKENAALRAEMQRLKGTNNVPAPAPALTQALTVVPTASAAAIENVPFNFLQNSAWNVTRIGNRLDWRTRGQTCFFISPEINHGIFKICVELKGGLHTCCGLAIRELLGTLSIANGNLFYNSGSCLLYHAGLYVGDSSAVPYTPFTAFAEGAQVTLDLELDVDRRTVHFFVNAVQTQHSVVNVPSAVHYVVYGCEQGVWIKVKSLTKLASPSTNPSVACVQHSWR